MTGPGVPPAHEPQPDPVAAPGAISLRGAVAQGRLRLGGLAPAVRRPSLVALGLLVLASLAILADALAIPLPGGVLLLPGRLLGEAEPVPVANVAMIGFLVGLAPASVALVASALAVPRRSTRAMVLVVAGVNLSIAASVLANLRLASTVAEVDPLAPWAVALGAGGAVAASLAVGIGGLVPPRDGLARRGSRLVAALAAVPGLLLATAYVVGLFGSAELPTPRPVELASYPDVLHIGAVAVAAPVYGALDRILPLILAPIVLWQAATWARASRAELAAPVVRRVDLVPWLLIALVTAKLGWLALGYLGRLPESLGGSATAWTASASDGIPAWLIAGAFAAGAAAWLAHPGSPRIHERGIEPGMRFVVGGFTAGSVLGGAIVVAAGILLLLPVEQPFEVAVRLGDVAAALIVPLQLATVPAALVAGVVLLRRGHHATGAFLAVAGAWMAPRAVFVLADALRLVPEGAANPLGVDLVTMDTLLTIVVAGLAVAALAGRRTGADAGSLALVLAVSTLMAHGGTLVPPGVVPVLLLAAVLFPPFRELVFGSNTLNEPSPVRPARVLGSLGRQGAALLVIAGTRTIVAGPGETGVGELGQVLFGPPYAALLVAAVVTMRRGRPGAVEIAEGTVVAPEVAIPGAPADARADAPEGSPAAGGAVRRPALGVAAGIAGLAIAVALGGLVVDPLVGRAWEPPTAPTPSQSPAPSPAPSGSSGVTPAPSQAASADLALFRALVPEVNVRMTALQAIVTERMVGTSGPELEAAGLDLARMAGDDLEWLTAQPLRACFVPYRDAVARHLAAYRDFGGAVASLGGGGGSDAEISRLVDEIGASLDGVVASLESAIVACGVSVATPSP